ncbi:hypothetical protein [Actinomycetospora soli]|nr:hypothetical protein [Actinomycetospora soli]MCD2191462.1 hypothetical protein [Actinomycetospora soli]
MTSTVSQTRLSAVVRQGERVDERRPGVQEVRQHRLELDRNLGGDTRNT